MSTNRTRSNRRSTTETTETTPDSTLTEGVAETVEEPAQPETEEESSKTAAPEQVSDEQVDWDKYLDEKFASFGEANTPYKLSTITNAVLAELTDGKAKNKPSQMFYSYASQGSIKATKAEVDGKTRVLVTREDAKAWLTKYVGKNIKASSDETVVEAEGQELVETEA